MLRVPSVTLQSGKVECNAMASLILPICELYPELCAECKQIECNNNINSYTQHCYV
jgi:hypothetical protein